VSRNKSGSFRVDLVGSGGCDAAGAGRPWLACPLGCTPVGPFALEVENGRVDLTDESGEPTGTADCGPPDHPEPGMRRPASLAGSDGGCRRRAGRRPDGRRGVRRPRSRPAGVDGLPGLPLAHSLAVGRRPAGRVGGALVTVGEGAGFDRGVRLYPAGGGQSRLGAVTDSDVPDPPSAKVVAALLRDARSLSRRADKLDDAAAVADSTTRQLAAEARTSIDSLVHHLMVLERRQQHRENAATRRSR
jgi:hypothetical protein